VDAEFDILRLSRNVQSNLAAEIGEMDEDRVSSRVAFAEGNDVKIPNYDIEVDFSRPESQALDAAESELE
jgi:hypothetical protein